ncbi:MAG TPA: AAA family ATPase, partial [Thermoleophilaceae bacterium]|nr:AAA family ATPase [Thermoleophilaceae bacterium]
MPETTRAADLLEREEELGALAGRLDEAASGQGGLVVVDGAAGVGKSALLRELVATARDRGALVTTAVGGELEREFPFGMVRQLLEPVVVGAPAKRRQKLLSGSAALAGPVLGGAPDAAAEGGDASFATLHGLYWLVAALAEEQPLVMVMDDCHWSDASSLRFVDFLARRAADLPVLVAIGIRPHEPGAEQALLDGLMDRPETELVRPAALSRTAVDALVDQQLGDRAEEGTAAAAHETTGGNPLLLRELVRNVEGQPGQITPAAVHEVVPSTVTRSVERRLGRLPADSREVATTLAVLGDRLGPELLPAMTGLGGEELVAAIEELRAAELLAGEPPRYAHPLLRQAVAESLPLVERHRLHRRAAEGLRGRQDMEEQLIVHLLAAPPLGEGWAEQVLRDGARRALAEGAADAAVRRLGRALEEHTGPTDHALLLDLGLAELRQGDPAAIGHLDAAAEAGDPVVAGTAVQAAMALRNLDAITDEHTIAQALRGALDRLGPDAPDGLSHGLLGNLLNTAMLSSNLAGERQAMLAEDRDDPPEPLLALRAFEGACLEAPADEVIELGRQAFASRPLLTLHKLEQPSELVAVAALSVVDGRDVADAALRDAEESARRHGSLIGRGFATYMRAEWGLVFGSAVTVEADAREAHALWQETGLANMTFNSASTLAQALVLMGRLDEAEELLAPLPLGEVEWVSNIGLIA